MLRTSIDGVLTRLGIHGYWCICFPRVSLNVPPVSYIPLPGNSNCGSGVILLVDVFLLSLPANRFAVGSLAIWAIKSGRQNMAKATPFMGSWRPVGSDFLQSCVPLIHLRRRRAVHADRRKGARRGRRFALLRVAALASRFRARRSGVDGGHFLGAFRKDGGIFPVRL